MYPEAIFVLQRNSAGDITARYFGARSNNQDIKPNDLEVI